MNASDPLGLHDWYSDEYVRDWIDRDMHRDRDFSAILDVVVRERPSRVLDIGGGYGRLTRAVLEVCPGSTVVVQDFSRPMLDQANTYLADYQHRFALVRTDLRDARWTEAVGRDFDAVVSAIAIHNVRDPELIARIYRDIAALLRPLGWFAEVDHVESTEARKRALVDAGFVAETIRADLVGPTLALMVGQRP
jgi:tRNA (cmo5U34)-methyltransferase